jgi:hypothetical protein
MPVTESIELDRAASDLGIPRGALIVNGLYPDLFPEGAVVLDGVATSTDLARSMVASARSAVSRRTEQSLMIGRLEHALPDRRIVLPLLATPRVGPNDVEALADHLGAL